MASVVTDHIVVPYRQQFAFQADAFQNDAFMASEASDWAFQQCAFQSDGFQADVCVDGLSNGDWFIIARRRSRR